MEENVSMPEDHQVLADVMPDVLKEEILMIELKNSSSNNDIKSVMLLTLRDDICDINSKPNYGETEYQIWCWNVRHGFWYLLDFMQVESAENWPPNNDK
jgi:hypothetical protein